METFGKNLLKGKVSKLFLKNTLKNQAHQFEDDTSDEPPLKRTKSIKKKTMPTLLQLFFFSNFSSSTSTAELKTYYNNEWTKESFSINSRQQFV